MISSSGDSVFYSQNDEARVILKYVQGAKDTRGTVLDIGAGDGRTFSNSLNLIERGWEAICIEPSPFAFAKLLELHGNNKKVTLLNCAIGTEDRIVKFYESSDTLYSTTHEKQAETWTERGMTYRSYHVPQISIKTMLEQMGAKADVLSIDCEGSSFDILGSCPSAWDPKIVIVEHDGRCVEISGWGRKHNYDVVALNAENLVLVKQ